MPPSVPDRPVAAARRRIHFTGRVIKKTAGSALSARFLLFLFYIFSRKGYTILNCLHSENCNIFTEKNSCTFKEKTVTYPFLIEKS